MVDLSLKYPLAAVNLETAKDALARAKRDLMRAGEVDLVDFDNRRDQELNAVSTAYDVCAWVFPELSDPIRKELAEKFQRNGDVVAQVDHFANMLSRNVLAFALARQLANTAKHRAQRGEVLIEATASATSCILASASIVIGEMRLVYRAKVIDPRTKNRYRFHDVAQNLIAFWDAFFIGPVDAIERARRSEDLMLAPKGAACSPFGAAAVWHLIK